MFPGPAAPLRGCFAGATPAHRAFEDVDSDGDVDLILHFKTRELFLQNESSSAMLLGQTHDRMLLGGSVNIEIISPKK